MTTAKNNRIDQYIAGFPSATQKLLHQLRETIHKAAPDAAETISYAIPTFTLNGNLVHFAGYQHHIGFYPGSSGIAAFSQELSPYKMAKGSVQFPLDKPLPLTLITKIVKYRIKESLEKATAKDKKKTLRTCPQGHQYYKSSDCPTCPACEEQRKLLDSFFSLLSAPARRALENKKITTLKQLSKFHETDILALHGMGPASIPKLRKALKNAGFSFKK